MDIPNYRILGKLGNGANSTLYHVQSLREGQHYTVKHVRVNSPEDMKFIDQLRDEHTVGSALDHPVIRKCYELRYQRRRLRTYGAMLFMEYVDGIEMGARDFHVSMIQLLAYFVRAAEGLRVMHDSGFVHADIKPGNLLVTPEDEVKIIDLGQSSRMNIPKVRVQGTIHYMAPEQAACLSLDQRTDVFGLGAALYRIISGRTIATEMNRLAGEHAPGLIGMRLDKLEAPPDVEIPHCVEKLITECCAKDPADRPKDMIAFIDRAKLASAILTTQQNRPEDWDSEEALSQWDEV